MVRPIRVMSTSRTIPEPERRRDPEPPSGWSADAPSVLKQGDGALSAVRADADDGPAAGGHGRELLDRLAEYPGAGGSERVPDRDAPAPRVDAVFREGAEGVGQARLLADVTFVLQSLHVAEN